MYLPLILALLVATLALLLREIREVTTQIQTLSEQRKRLVLAIMSPSALATVEYVRPLIAFMKKYAAFEFEILECVHAMDRDRAQEWVHFIAEKKADLIFSLGRLSTDVLYTFMKTQNEKIPIIAAGSPIGYNDVPLEVMQLNVPMTGVSARLDWPKKLAYLKRLLPHIKTVCIVFRSIDEISHSNLKEKNAMTAALRKMQVSWRMHHVSSIEKSSDFSAEALQDIDIVILSRSSSILQYSARIAQEAAQFGVPVFSSDGSCPNIFVGIVESPEREIAIQSAKYAIDILEDGVSTSTLPLKEIRDREQAIIYPHNSSPILATTILGNLLGQSNHIRITLLP